MNFRFDLISFLIGMAAATVVWWLIFLLRPIIERQIEAQRVKRQEDELKRRSGLEGDYLTAIYKYTQSLHLASSLFPLDEIVETPQLLAPPVNPDPNTPHPHQDIVEQTLPYIPDYPELGAYYDAPSITLLEAISGGLHLAVIGQPGTGKSIALANLASQLTNPYISPDTAPQYVPFLIHAADLGSVLSNASKIRDTLALIVERITPLINALDGPRFRRFAEFNFNNGRALLLLDGVDELPQSAIQEVKVYLSALLKQYPKAHIILTAAPEFVDGLGELGFTCLALKPWSTQQQSHFINNWGDLWERYLSRESWAQQPALHIDRLLLNRWLGNDHIALTPLELTLKIWGAYGGDSRSGSSLEAIRAQILRLSPPGVSLENLSSLALEAILGESPFFDGRQATNWIKASNQAARNLPAVAEPDPETPLESGNVTPKSNGQSQQISNLGLISELSVNGLITNHTDGKLRFSHPVFLNYLAGYLLSSQTEKAPALLAQKPWMGQSGALRYLAAYGDVSDIATKFLSTEDPVLMRPQLAAGRLLRDSNQPRNSTWRAAVIAALVNILRDEDHAIGLRGAVLASLVFSGDNKVAALFRQLLMSESNDLRQLAALGAGLTRDARSLEILVSLTSNSLESTRRAACLALVEIGTPQALEEVAVFLLHGDEQLRIYAAEALANNHQEGREALREGLASDDILVRRAIIYGLSRIDEPWAVELLEKSQVNEEQWAVRNLAVELLAARQAANPHIPRKQPAPHENPWVIEFAGRYGMGVSPSQPSENIFLLALKDSNRDYFRPALNYLHNSPSKDLFSTLYPFIYGNETETRESAYQTLLDIARSGVELPNPRQFGLG